MTLSLRSPTSSPRLFKSCAGPLLISLQASELGLADDHQGLYVEYANGTGVMLLGDAYVSARASGTVTDIIAYWATHELIFGPEIVPTSGSVVADGSTPFSTRTICVETPAARGAATFIASVPNSCNTGFGMFNTSDAGGISNVTNSALATSLSQSLKGWAYARPNVIRVYQPFPLTFSRASFLYAMANNVPHSDKSEVRGKTSAAVASVLSVIGRGSDNLVLNVPFLLDGEQGMEGFYVEDVHTRRFVDGRPASMSDPNTLFISQNDTASCIRGDVQTVARYSMGTVPVPVFGSDYRTNSALYGRFLMCGLNARDGLTHFGDVSSFVARGEPGVYAMPRSAPASYVIPIVEDQYPGYGYGFSSNSGSPPKVWYGARRTRPAALFGGHITRVLGPLASRWTIADTGASLQSTDYSGYLGATTFETVYQQYLTALTDEAQVGLPSGLTSQGFQMTEQQYVAAVPGGASAFGHTLDATYTDTNYDVGVSPKVLATAFGLALNGELTLTKLIDYHRGLRRIYTT